MTVDGLHVQGRRVTISGHVTPPLANAGRDRTIEVRQRVACGREQVVARFTPRPNGAYSGTVSAPAGAAATVYRLRTKVRINARSGRTTNTFTVPRAVEFGG